MSSDRAFEKRPIVVRPFHFRRKREDFPTQFLPWLRGKSSCCTSSAPCQTVSHSRLLTSNIIKNLSAWLLRPAIKSSNFQTIEIIELQIPLNLRLKFHSFQNIEIIKKGLPDGLWLNWPNFNRILPKTKFNLVKSHCIIQTIN